MVRLEVKGVQFSYRSSPVLKDVSLKVDGGEILGVTGPNGSGKTTLLKCINKLLKIKVGSVFIDEKNIEDLGRKDISKKFGYVPQIEKSSFPFTVFDAVLLGRMPYVSWAPSNKDLEVVSDILEMLGLKEFAMADINELSGGELQKVIIARALVQEPEVLLLDEPTSNLDIFHQLEILELIRELSKRKGLTVVTVFHDLNLAARFCDKLLLLKSGKIHSIGSVENVLKPKNIEEVYQVNVRIARHPLTNSLNIVVISQRT